ncbi:alpha/beta hydrolase [Candidatus Daviesbacteria bacterium RIFCSPHIGHO2_01_FULL_44_29]|uniref:Alpha/beta hydrolase n=1 Tax=Candidatus Daviesbacteria bacterium RIFCSPHIGHO2_02_FULL_43_12 TaxID=1797776 RepID=A0A1F5KJL0_9BACT|nr:MAG: alpha/beta hydrolase [Candidatus Daviesbacteria bacterium RIFCSPHIGHO2_01_FULL_44_29]OGE39057.1 MAG: alpha/beta hydrolase [Candidatus Daviesbacteria bacterium RIFCSPHIGHO2_12_FULL_47_45]OGE41098.1 MAG: alpha/beta hydrolase [Candidatus Daviesbacteria bacterium RIFCSPHIGHO2_02_FULL_43_12]OGE69297.1 MAG: alpha/beta hydrolase [Candidatus Daviesbacteria bacterium RIFCSPLOWO2_01_FULL_43_15]
MKNAIIFHGTDDNPDRYWYKWLGKELEKGGYIVSIPYNPTINKEPINTFLPKVLKQHTFDSETLLVGHSSGGPLILSILEHIDVRITKAVLVAGYSQHPDEQMEDLILQEKYNWEKIKQNVKEIVFINSVNDPWSCDDKQGRIMFDHLGGTQIILFDGHFGSTSNGQVYDEFPLLLTVTLGRTK